VEEGVEGLDPALLGEGRHDGHVGRPGEEGAEVGQEGVGPAAPGQPGALGPGGQVVALRGIARRTPPRGSGPSPR